ncbi:hypothetical protein ACF8PL_11435 [Delftia sp. WSY_4]|jgi:hypothetical protein|nr:MULTISPECIES: hypothetical protein [Delftia]KEH11497.1 hypothetical protein GY15_27960 [Delftia sp. 670]MPT04492.1 hypothetical protein [Delftia sp.]MXN32378.1 hypothetical protein [Delftia sp. CH05]KAF1037473.1 MAG: hypothetical protein GAK34_03234 [Delftia tsuruhatensis]MCX7508468.1 hypothetical protein [Delftia tsuruhatensis]
MHMANDEQKDRAAFDAAIQALKAEVANAGVHLSLDSSARLAYARQIQAMANELQLQATSGRITWGQAAQQAQEARNVIMEIIRGRSTPVGRAMAQRIKSEGKTLNELIARKAQQLHGPNVRFDRLTAAQQNAVYGEIVKSAGKSNAAITQRMRTLSRAGRGLLVFSIAVSVYTIANADNKVEAAGKELAVTGAGIGGGMAGGALAGLACGPGAPACVVVGAFVGGALAAIGVEFLW